MSDRDLDGNLGRLVCHERAHLVEILDHINEVDRRRLHRELGFSSLFCYCVSRLKYSHSAAGRRIAAARALRRVPGARGMLASGDVSLTTLSMVACVLSPANRSELLARIRGKSEREVKCVVSEYRPEPPRRDRIRPLCIQAPPPSVPGPTLPGLTMATGVAGDAVREREARQTETPHAGQLEALPRGQIESLHAGRIAPLRPVQTETSREESTAGRVNAGTPGAGSALSKAAPRIVRRNEIRFLADDAFLEKLDEMKALLSSRGAGMTLEQVFDAAMEAYLEAHSPARRHRRRVKRNRRQDAATSLPAPGVTARHIPVAVRDAVYSRDGARCTFVGPDGRRCDARRNLQVDHVRPFALGGSHEPGNLRLLCRVHNLLAAERAYGREAIAGYARRE